MYYIYIMAEDLNDYFSTDFNNWNYKEMIIKQALTLIEREREREKVCVCERDLRLRHAPMLGVVHSMDARARLRVRMCVPARTCIYASTIVDECMHT